MIKRMYSQRSRLLDVCYATIVLLCIGLFVGCSGGTRGTGASQVQGTVRTLMTDAPVADVMVTVEAKNDTGAVVDAATTSTDDSGMFSVEIQPGASTLAFQFSGEGIDADVDVLAIPEDFASAAIEFRVDEERDTVSTPKVEFTPRDVPEDDGSETTPVPPSDETPIDDPVNDPPEDGTPPPNDELPPDDQVDPPVVDDPIDDDPRLQPLFSCNLARELMRIRDEILNGPTDFPDERPRVRIEVLSIAPDTRCDVFRRVTNIRRCRDAVRRINETRLAQLSSREKRVVCRGQVRITGFKNGEQFERVQQVRGVWRPVDGTIDEPDAPTDPDGGSTAPPANDTRGNESRRPQR